MSWFKKLLPSKISTNSMTKKSIIPEGLWTKCDACASVLFKAELDRNVGVCPKCDHHHRLGARRRIAIFLDDTIKEELGKHFEPIDRFKFKDTKKYKDRLVQAQKQTGEKDALVVMRGTVCGIPVMVAAFDFNFIGGSMGAVVGERFVLAAETALASGIPFICFATSGGARMQESLVSLMQMAKTTAALRRLHEAGIPYLSVMLDPCMGGVSASLAMLGDINIAEPKALIGFSGPRVIQQTIRQTLPEGFQRSEFLLERGFVDLIIHRCDMKFKIACLLAKMLHLPEPPQPVAVKVKDKPTTKREAIDE